MTENEANEKENRNSIGKSIIIQNVQKPIRILELTKCHKKMR